MKVTLSIAVPLFVDFIGSLFVAHFAFGLYHNGIRFRFFVVLFVKIEVIFFQMKNEQFSHSYYLLLPVLFHWKSFQQIHTLLSNILLSPLIRANIYFRYNKRCEMQLFCTYVSGKD